MAGFNLFNTNATTSTTQSAPFGVSSPTNTSNLLFGSNTSGFGQQATPQNQSFGGSTTAGNISFGLPKTQTNLTFGTSASINTTGGLTSGQPNLTFGNPAAQSNAAFGLPPGQPNVSIGTVAPQPTLGFGTPTGQASFGSPGALPSFGSLKPQTPTGGGLFGSAPAGTPQGTGFGSAPASSLQGTGFGSVAASVPQVGFGGVAASAPQVTGFGGVATSAPQVTGFGGVAANAPQVTGFGGVAANAPQVTGFGSAPASTLQGTGFGSAPQGTGLLGTSTPATNTNVVKPTFGGTSFINTSSGQPGLSFGLQTNTAASTAQTTAATQPMFSLPTSSATPAATTGQTLSFGQGGTSQSLSFGSGAPSLTTSSAQPTSTQSRLGTGLTFGAAPTTAPTLSFGNLSATTAASTATTTSSLLGSSFGAPTSTSSSGIFSWQKPTTEAVTSSSTSLGLGGVDHTAVSTAQSATNTVVSAKEQMLPNEIQQTVASFKAYVKTQKNLSSEVARTSSEPLTKLTQQIGALNNLILTLGSILSQQKFTAEKIKLETIKSLNDYELAQKIKDSPVASEERMYAIRKYFIEKISAFEESTKTLQEKIEYVYQHVITLPQENSLSAEALKLIVKKLHDSFVVIGARAYKLHNDMQLLKVQYLTLRNQYVKDNSSISFSLNRELQLPFSDVRSRSNTTEFSLEGPNPFSKTASGSFNSLLLTSQNRNFPPTTTPSKEWNVSGFNATKSFGFSDISPSVGFDQNSSLNLSGNQQFNLQKPPIGNKRGKR